MATLNAIKMLIISFNDQNQMVPDLIITDYFRAKDIKGRFCVIHREQEELLEFNCLLAAYKYAENMYQALPFNYSSNFNNNFRIVELDNDKNIVATIINCVDFFDTIVQLKHNNIDDTSVKDLIKDSDFLEYYQQYKDII